MPQEDEVFPTEEQPLPAAASPTAQSPNYVSESDPEADPEEDDDEDPEEDTVDYRADGRDDGDDEDESSEDDEDDDMDIKADDDDEEEDHPAHADSVVVALHQLTDRPHPARRQSPPVPTPVWSDAEIPSPPLPVSSPVPVLSPSPPASPIRPLGYRAAMIRLRAEAASTSYSLPLPPPLHLLSTDRIEDRPESSSAAAARPPGGLRADYGFVATMDREIRRDLERDVG
ncbi:hypothetical protein Tco_0113338, partial [Tanacetum coccineum]